MEKIAYMHSNYPQIPPQMSAAGASATGGADEHMEVPAPPSYEQATTTTGPSTSAGAHTHTPTYPPVQVLPTPRASPAQAGVNQQQRQHQQQQQQQQAPTRAQPYYGDAGSLGTAYPVHTAATSTYVTLQRQGVSSPMVHQPLPQQQSVVIIQQQAMLPLGPEPAYVFCPTCHIQKLTRIEYEPSTRTHLMAALLCVLGLWCCVCLPYCAGSCMNTNHYCGNCNKFLGSYGNAL